MEALQFWPFVALLVLFYLLIIRPQQKRASAHRDLIGSLTPMDRIVTNGGIHGTVQSVDDGTIRLEIAPGTVVTVGKQHVVSKQVDASGDES